METHAARSTSTKEKKLTNPPSRRSFVKRSPSTVLASRNLRRKRSPKGFRLALLRRLDLAERVKQQTIVGNFHRSRHHQLCPQRQSLHRAAGQHRRDGARGHARKIGH